MLAGSILFAVCNQLLRDLQALREGVLFDRVSFASHGAFVRGDFVGFQQVPICWNFHSLTQLNNVPH